MLYQHNTGQVAQYIHTTYVSFSAIDQIVFDMIEKICQFNNAFASHKKYLKTKK